MVKKTSKVRLVEYPRLSRLPITGVTRLVLILGIACELNKFRDHKHDFHTIGILVELDTIECITEYDIT